MSPKVLFVDDDESNLIVSQAVCGDEFDVLTASDGTQALALMRTNEVAVIVSDQRMPNMTGVELLEQVHLEFTPEGIRRVAEIAYAVNERQENIGARRLYTVMERLLEDVSFHAARRTGETIEIDAAFVNERLEGIAGDDNLAQYIL